MENAPIRLALRHRVWACGLVVLVAFVILVMTPRRYSSEVVLVSSGTGSSSLSNLDLGNLSGLAGGVLRDSGTGLIELRRIQAMVSSEPTFLAMLAADPTVATEFFGLGSGASYRDSVRALNSYRRRFVSTRLDVKSSTLSIRVHGDSRPLVARWAALLSSVATDSFRAFRARHGREEASFLTEQRRQAEFELATAEDSLVAYLEANALGAESPRVRQRIESIRRRIALWSSVMQAISIEEIRTTATATSKIPDVVPVGVPSIYAERTGFGIARSCLLAVLSGLIVWVLLGLADRWDPSAVNPR